MPELSHSERETIATKHLGGFPARVNISLSRDDDKNVISFSKFKNTKIKLSNIKYSQTEKFSIDRGRLISLGIFEVDSHTELERILDELSDTWVDKKDDAK